MKTKSLVLNFEMMKSPFVLLSVIAILLTCCSPQQKIKSLIKKDLNSRFTDVEIVSMTPDSCPNMGHLFDLSLSMRIMASQCKLDITKITNRYYDREITLDRTSELCKLELEKISKQSDDWQKTYFSNSEKCFLVKYRYGGSDGLKITVEDYYSLDPDQYKEGNYPYLHKEFDVYYGLNIYEEVSKLYKDFLLDIVYN